MPKGNIKGGKKHKRNKNYASENKTLRLKEPGQEYAKVINCKGNCRFDVLCCDGKTRAAILCGAMRKRKFINQGQLILDSIRDFQDNVCDIIDSYEESQAKRLKSDKEIPDTFILGEENPYDSNDDNIEFVTDLPPEDIDDDFISVNKNSDNSDSDNDSDINIDDI